MRHLRTVLALTALVAMVSGCSAQAGAVPADSSEPIAAAEARDEAGGRPPTRCNGVWDCTKTVVTDFIYLPVRVARGIGGDVREVREEEQHAPAE